MRRWLRRGVPAALEGLGIFGALRGRPRTDRALVLRYHSVSEPTAANSRYRCPTIAVSPRIFERQMRHLAEGYTVVPLGALVDALGAGRPFPERAVAITFDDGYRDNHEHALPVLRSLGLPATVFVTSDAVGDGWRFWVARVRWLLLATEAERVETAALGTLDLTTEDARTRAVDALTAALCRVDPAERDARLDELGAALGVTSAPEEARRWTMDWPELSELADAGVEIGGHTRSHPILTAVDRETARREVAEGKAALEQGLGREVPHFAYPNGPGVAANHDDAIATLVAEAGYRSASTSLNGSLLGGSDRFRLRRIPVSDWARTADFAFALERDRLPLLGYPERR